MPLVVAPEEDDSRGALGYTLSPWHTRVARAVAWADREGELLVATISTADFRNGMGLRINGKYYTIVEFQHVKPGKGGAFVRYKIKDLQSGRTIDQTCNAGSKFENVQLITREMQYLYNDGTSYYFMDNETFDQIPVSESFIGENARWLKENDNCQLLYADTELLGVNPPMFIEVEITSTDACWGRWSTPWDSRTSWRSWVSQRASRPLSRCGRSRSPTFAAAPCGTWRRGE